MNACQYRVCSWVCVAPDQGFSAAAAADRHREDRRPMAAWKPVAAGSVDAKSKAERVCVVLKFVKEGLTCSCLRMQPTRQHMNSQELGPMGCCGKKFQPTSFDAMVRYSRPFVAQHFRRPQR